MFNYIKDLFSKKLPPAKELYLDHSTEGIQKLIELTRRMEAIELSRRKNEEFITAIFSIVDPKLTEKDKNGHFLFLSQENAIETLKKTITKLTEEKTTIQKHSKYRLLLNKDTIKLYHDNTILFILYVKQ